MKLNTAVKYQISEMRNPLVIFYSILFAFIALILLSSRLMGGNVSLGGLEMTSVIFIFIAGLNSFKTSFHFFLANSTSRKTLFNSFIGSILPVCAFMALLDTAIGLILPTIIRYNSLFSQVFEIFKTVNQPAITILVTFVWSLFLYAFIASVGYFLTILYYRMSKLMKLVFSFGVPILLLIVLPYIDRTITNGAIYKWIHDFFSFILGYINGEPNPYCSMLSFAVLFCVFTGLSYLLMRRAELKDK